jgi:hypothetical protein
MNVASTCPSRQGYVEHVFDEIRGEQLPVCELCAKEVAAYRWSEHSNRETPGEQLFICRVCAGMILLVGRTD